MNRVFCIVLVAIAACGSGCAPGQSDRVARVQEALRGLLKDPDSVRFQNVRTVNGHVVCGEYNAKNGFGGYVGFEPFYGRDDDAGGVEVYTASANPFGSHFAELLENACRDRSHMTLEESGAETDRWLEEFHESMRRLDESDSKAQPEPSRGHR